jgi:hypothetical protein
LQTLVYDHQGTLAILALGSYNSGFPGRYEYYAVCNSIDIILNGNKVKGILASNTGYSVNEATRSYPDLRKGQISGGGGAYYILMDDIIDTLSKSSVILKQEAPGTILPENVPVIGITSSSCLVDPKIPLRYGIQSAFDGDPATSYVENTEDDLIVIRIYVGDSRKMAIINGYAQNQSLYYANNRVKKLIWPIEIEFYYDILGYQFADIPHGQEIKTSELYKGNRHNDTCIAELNLKGDHGWLFGDIDE